MSDLPELPKPESATELYLAAILSRLDALAPKPKPGPVPRSSARRAGK